jgi:hemolysin III
MRSHGAYALSRVLTISECIEEVYLVGHRIGPYGSIAIFDAVGDNPCIRTLLLRGCRIGERGAMAFVERVLNVVDEDDGSGGSGSSGRRKSGLRTVDLSACRIGFRGTFAIEERLRELGRGGVGGVDVDKDEIMIVDLEGNMVFQEVMNCVTHGLGIVLGTLGQYLLNKQILGQPSHYTISCAIYSASVITLYMSSTLYHSFFALRRTKFIFKVFDRCAIYLLIAGSYTPFLMIGLHHKPRLSAKLLLFIWGCAISGILVEAFFLTWEHKSKFSLAMYLGMGWTCMSCLPDLLEVLPMNAVGLLVAGGVAYTGGV